MFPSFEIGGQEFFSYPLLIGMMWAYSFMYLKKYFSETNIYFPHWNTFYSVLFLFAWFGAKIFFLLTLDDQVLSRATLSTNFWLGGGFVFYGGLLGGMIWVLTYKAIFRVDWKLMSIFIPVLAFGHGVGRIGCFLAGCCYGRYCDLPWSVEIHGGSRHPTQLYEATCLFVLAWLFRQRVATGKPVILEYILSYSVIRFLIEFFRGDEIRGFYFAFSTSQAVSFVLAAACLVGIFVGRRAEKNFDHNTQL